MSKKETIEINYDQLVKLRQRLKKASEPEVRFRGTSKEDIAQMKEDAEYIKTMGLFYATEFVKQFVP